MTQIVKTVGLAATAMTPIERSMGRFMRAPEHPAPESNPAGNNSGENQGAGSTESGDQNNGGQGFDLEAFWGEGEGDDDGSPSGESDDSKPKPSSSPTGDNPQANPAQQIVTQLDSMQFQGLMTPEILEKLGEGDHESFNKGLNDFGKQVARQTLGLAVGVMRQLREQMYTEMESKFNSRLTDDKNFDALTQAIPSAASAKMGPTIKNIYSRALAKTKGKTDAAIAMTKQVLQLQAETFGEDLGLNVAPRTHSDNYSPKKTNWLEELNALEQ